MPAQRSVIGLSFWLALTLASPINAQVDLRDDCRRRAGFNERDEWHTHADKIPFAAVQACRAAAKAHPNDPRLLAYLGRALYIHGYLDESYAVISQAAKATTVGKALMGIVLANGYGVRPDATEAVRWYYQAARLGFPMAQYNLAVMLEDGEGTPENKAEAAQWYQRAAEQGYALAQHNLGTAYEKGRGVAQNYQEAVRWYRAAADQGNDFAANNLGWMYEEGNGVRQDFAAAVQWYRRAAELGNATAQANLATMYAEGRGVPRDATEARRWNLLAASQGDRRALSRLTGVREDDQQNLTRRGARAATSWDD